MAFTDNLKKAFGVVSNKVGDAAKTTADKAKLMTEIAKLNVKITAEEDKIKKAQAALGKQYYNDFEAGLPMEAETYLPMCDEIKASKDLIAEYRAKIEDLKAAAEAAKAAKAAEAAEAECCCEEAAAEETCCCEAPVEETCCCEEATAEETCCCETPAEETIEFTVVEDEKNEQ